MWRYDEPDGVYGEVYWDRLQELAYDVEIDPAEFALRFCAFAPGVTTAIVGSGRPENLATNAEWVERGPLPADVLEHVAERWSAVGQAWGGET